MIALLLADHLGGLQGLVDCGRRVGIDARINVDGEVKSRSKKKLGKRRSAGDLRLSESRLAGESRK